MDVSILHQYSVYPHATTDEIDAYESTHCVTTRQLYHFTKKGIL